MVADEVMVVVVDPSGTEVARHVLRHPDRLMAGQELWLSLGGREGLVRVLGELTGERGARVARVLELRLHCPFCAATLLDLGGPAAVEEDEDGDFVACPWCRRRVAIERVPSTPPGGPVRLRVARDQDR